MTRRHYDFSEPAASTVRQDPSIKPERKGGEVDRETLQKFETVFASIPRRQRDIFLAHRFEDLSYAEIADLTGMSVRQVERQIAKAIYKIHKQLEGVQLRWWERWF